MKVKLLSRDPGDYVRDTTKDIQKVVRNHNAPDDPFRAQVEYTRALNATKLNRVFAKPFIASLDGHNEGVHLLARHPTRLSTVISGARDGQIKIWNLPTKKCLRTIQTHNGPVNGISVDKADSETFVTVGHDCQLKMWRFDGVLESTPGVPSAQQADELEPAHSIAVDGVPMAVSHLANSTDFVTAGEVVNVWKPYRDSPLRTYKLGVNTVHAIAANPVEPDVLVGAAANRVLWLLDTRHRVPLTKVTMKLRANAVKWNPQEAFSFAVASDDYNAYTFDSRFLSQPVYVHEGHTAAVIDVDYSPTGRELVTASFDRSIRIFPYDKLHSREVYHTRRMHQALSVLYSQDSKFVLSGSSEMNVRVWKANASEKLGPLRAREKAALDYSNKLREVYGDHPEISRIARHRHVPKSIYSARKEHLTSRNAAKRREANAHAHSGGAEPQIDKYTHMAATVDD